MFRREVMTLQDVINQYMRQHGLETPLLEKRVVDAWTEVMGPMIARHTGDRFIRGGVLNVKIFSPALRADLQMEHTRICERLNWHVGSRVITDVRVY